MPDLWADVDIALAEVPVNAVPLMDDTTFKDIETAVLYDAAGIYLVWNFFTTAGAFSSTAVTPTSSGVHDWAEHTADKGMYTVEIPVSGGTVDNNTEGVGWFTGGADGVLPWRGPFIGFRHADLNDALIDGTDLSNIAKYLLANSLTLTNIVQDDSIIAKMIATGGTVSGFDEDTDSLQSVRDAITEANPQNHSATANNETGNTTLDGGTYANTTTDDGSYYQTGPGVAVGGFGLNCDLTFSINTGRVPIGVIVDGKFTSGGVRTVQVWAYDYMASAYVQISNSATDFGNSVNDSTEQYAMTQNMVQISDGEIKIRFTSTSETGSDVWNCDLVTVSSVAQEAAGLTADALQLAVWARADTGHDDDTLGYNLSQTHLLHGLVVSATDASQFIIDGVVAANDCLNGMLITVEDITDEHYEVRRIVDSITSTNEIFVDRAFGFTPAAGDHIYVMNSGYADVNVTHVGATAQTALDINDILDDTSTLDLLLEALVYKQKITESNGNTEIFNSAGVSQGTVSACYTSVAGTTQRLKVTI